LIAYCAASSGIGELRTGDSMHPRLIGLFAGLLATTPVFAHDFWLQPVRFIMPAPAAVPMLLYVGHGAARERWGVGIDRVVQFKSSGPDGLIDRKPNLTLDGPQVDAVVPLTKRGSYVLAFQSLASKSDLPFLRFNDYVTTEGLTPIATNRERTGTQKSNGREIYSRRAKAIVQIGPVDAEGAARVTRPVGLSLEIVPERHPLLLKPGEKMPVRVLFNRRPLAGALMKLTDLDADAVAVATMKTDSTGRAYFVIPHKGSWQFNIVWSEVVSGNASADYVTTFSSLTFGT
jgi:Domain of unknown function (DUF4198)